MSKDSLVIVVLTLCALAVAIITTPALFHKGIGQVIIGLAFAVTCVILRPLANGIRGEKFALAFVALTSVIALTKGAILLASGK